MGGWLALTAAIRALVRIAWVSVLDPPWVFAGIRRATMPRGPGTSPSPSERLRWRFLASLSSAELDVLAVDLTGLCGSQSLITGTVRTRYPPALGGRDDTRGNASAAGRAG
jgi:pimeloyl-ACP methyl ester carboxylesterase